MARILIWHRGSEFPGARQSAKNGIVFGEEYVSFLSFESGIVCMKGESGQIKWSSGQS
jgi:hypothetical protein